MYDETIVLSRGLSSCTVNLHGATITSWRFENEEQLFLSEHSIYHMGQAIRGGISIVFPYFGLWDLGPQHGFARILPWKVLHSPRCTSNNDVEAVFQLEDNELTRSFWNFAFQIRYKVILREYELETNLAVYNPDQKFSFNLLFQTYINVPDVEQCGITGLKGTLYRDNANGNIYQLHENRHVVKIGQYIERIYHNTRDEHTVRNTNYGRKLVINKHNLPDTLIYNPWKERAAQLVDFGDEEYLNMLCVGSGMATQQYTLNRGVTYEASQILKVV